MSEEDDGSQTAREERRRREGERGKGAQKGDERRWHCSDNKETEEGKRDEYNSVRAWCYTSVMVDFRRFHDLFVSS